MTMVNREEAARMSVELVNWQNFYSVAGGGGVGLLGAVCKVYNEDDNSEALTDLITGVGGGVLGQGVVFFVASREPATNPILKFFQNQCIWLLKTPLPAIVGAASLIGVRFLVSRNN